MGIGWSDIKEGIKKIGKSASSVGKKVYRAVAKKPTDPSSPIGGAESLPETGASLVPPKETGGTILASAPKESGVDIEFQKRLAEERAKRLAAPGRGQTILTSRQNKSTTLG